MNRSPVSSSNLVSVGYDAGQRLLEIEFKGGRVYQYTGVPERVYSGLMNASSHGSYFHKHIRDRYPTRQIT